MSEASVPATCPHGHADTVKLLSTVALGGTSPSGPPAASGTRPAGGGGCCGGACGCR